MYSVSEEIANATSHGLGVVFGVTILVILAVVSAHQHDAWKVVSSVLFGSTVVLMYSASTLYHSLAWSRARRFLRTLDHSAIYLLIAGTYTPFCLVILRGGWGWSLFGVTWGLALLGLWFKIFFVERFELLSTIIYVLIGWLAIIAVKPIVHHLAPGGIVWMFAGGCSYTFGVIFYMWERPRYTHCIWHLFVLGGTLCHFFAILCYVVT